MTDLDPAALAVLGAARRALGPSPGEKARVLSALSAKVAAGTPPSTDASPAGLALGPAGALVGALLVGGAGFGAGYLVGKSHSHPVTQLVTVTVPAPPPSAPLPSPGERAAEAEPAARERPHVTAAASGPAGNLAEEVAMLQDAQRSLRSGDPLVALAILRRLDEKFPRGALREEREAAQVLARCASDGTGEARAPAEAFLEKYPTSVYAARVRAACQTDAPPPGDSPERR